MLDTQMLIGSKFVAGSEAAEAIINPKTEETIVALPDASPAQVDAAVEAAAAAFKTWSRTTPAERSTLLLKLADAIERDAEAFATLEALKGARDARLAQRATKMLQEERFHLMFGMETVRSFAALSPKARRDLGDGYQRALAEAENQLGSIDKLSRLASLGVVSADAMEARRNSLENLSRRLNDVWA